MLLLSHVGITLGTALLLKRALSHRASVETDSAASAKDSDGHSESSANVATCSSGSGRPHWSGSIDWRLVIFGSMLPDIIDKPIGTEIFASTFSNGRIFTHTLLVNLSLLLIGLYLYYGRKRTWMLVIALCSIFHLILDEMWREPTTLLWPLRGWEFPKGDLTDLWIRILESLHTQPSEYITEIIGTIIIVVFLVYLLMNDSVLPFIKTGRIAPKHQ